MPQSHALIKGSRDDDSVLHDEESLIPVHSYTMVHHSEPIIAASCSLKDSNNDNAANSWCGRWSMEVHE